MGETTTKDVILHIQTNFTENLDQLAKLQKQLDELRVAELQVNAAVKAGTKTRQDADKELEAIAAEIRNVKTQQREYRKEIDNEIKAHEANEGSIKQMRSELANMRKEYESLSKAERQSPKGDELLDNIKKTTDSLKTLEQAQGDYRREVGHYQNAIQNLSPTLSKALAEFKNLSNGTMSAGVAFKNAVPMLKAFGSQLLTLLTNPIVATFVAIAAAVMKLVDSFKKNDQAMTELQSAFAAFKPVIDVIEKAFQSLVGVVTKAVAAIGKGVKAVLSLIPSFKEYADAEEDIVRATDDLQESERQYTIDSAKRQAEISELKSKSVETDKYTFEQRKDFLQQAIDLEQKELEEKRTNAAEKLRIAEKEAALSIGYYELTDEAYNKLSDDVKNSITDLRAAVINTEKEYNDGTKRLKSQMSNFTNHEKQEQQSRNQAAANAAKERKATEREALNALEKMTVEAIKNLQDKEYSLTKLNGEKQISELKRRLSEEKNLTQTARRALNQQIILLEADLQLKLAEMRENHDKETYKREIEYQKALIEQQLKASTDNDFQLSLSLKLNEIDTDLIVKGVRESLKQVKIVAEQAQQDFESLDFNQLAEKYGAVWETRGINFGDNIANMRELVRQYNEEAVTETAKAENLINAILKASETEKQRIIDEHTKNVHDKQVNELDLARKHAEILRAIELEGTYDEFGRNEAEKTRIMQEQAEARLQVTKDEHARLSAEREMYTDEELTAIYGSVQEYDNILADSSLKVVQAENAVKDAIKAVTDESINQKSTMIQSATSIMGAVDNILGSMQGLFKTLAESDEKYSDFATAMALMQILVSTAISIANAIQGATAAGAATGVAAPLTTPLFITEMVSIVLGAITSATTTLMKAKQQKQTAPKFAEGGVIGGGYAANSAEGTRDDVTISASRGEYIINAATVKRYGIPFFDSINGGKSVVSVTRFADGGYISDATIASGNYQFQMDLTRELIVEAVGNVQPVVSVVEITKAQNRVQMAENIAQR